MTRTENGRPVVVGVSVDAVTTEDVVNTVLAWTEDDAPPRVAVGVNAHVCNLAASDPSFRLAVNRADLAYADGQSIVWASRMLGSPVHERIATTDLVYPLMDACARNGKPVFLFGGRPGVAEIAAERLRERAPGLLVATRDGYGAASDPTELLAAIEAHGTAVLLVGLGDPLQQEWVVANRGSLRTPAILTCGGLFDWTSGSNRRAPQWMIGAGLEWLWRLILEPRRLGARYLIGNPLFIARLGLQLARTRRRRA